MSPDKYYESLICRTGENGFIKYFTASDFDGLCGERVTFPSGDNVLTGYFYTNASPDDPALRSELVVFCHGLGGGHRSYMTEIDVLCRRGYTVFAFDCTGCFESGGETIVALSHSLTDLTAALAYLRENGAFAEYCRVHLVGHSAGGFAAGCAGICEGIDSVTVISGYVSVDRYIRAVADRADTDDRDGLYRALCDLERRASPDTFGRSTAEAAAKSGARYLFTHSRDDAAVPFADNTGYLMKELTRVTYVICDGRGHNPNYTADAVAYMDGVFTGFTARLPELETVEAKREYLADADWRRMTAQNAEFWEKVFAFLREE